MGFRLALLVGALSIATAIEVVAQPTGEYRAVDDWAALPEGRAWGAVTGVFADPDGRHIWVLDRCGANSCLGSELDPVFKFDLEGNLVTSFGAGLFAWPHGFYVDDAGNVWVTDGPTGARAEAAAAEGKGQQVFKLSPEGSILMTLGAAGATGGPQDQDRFNGPSDVLVAPTGEIYVLDGHGEGGNNRVVKFTPEGRFVRSWGTSGPGPAAGELSDAHAIAMDSQGRIFVGDRRNIRIQIFDRDGSFLEQWTHFGPPSSIYIDRNDVIYVTDTQTAALPSWYGERRGEGWVRGIRVGDAKTGRVTTFIRSDAEFVAADRAGNVYGAHVPGERLVKHERIPSPSYRLVEGWAQLPNGVDRWGQTIGVEIDPAGYLWVFHRCFANNCVEERASVPAMLKFDMSGKMVDSWGEGMFVWPHGSFLDADGNIWATDAQGREGIGHQVFKFSPDGDVLMTLGKAGVAGDGEDTFNGPADVVVAKNGDIFVADGHGNNRVVKFSGDGRFLMSWGRQGTAPGEFNEPHTLALDSRGRLFVGDRVNQRIQVFDQDGNFLDVWPDIMASGIHITEDDLVFVADYQLQNGIVIANAHDFSPVGFIPEALAEGVAVADDGSVYVGEVIFRHLKKFVRN